MLYAREIPNWQGLRVTVMGLGTFGGSIGVINYLCQAGAQVTVTDLKSEKDLTESISRLKDYDLTLHLGGHRNEDFQETELLVISPAVPTDSLYVQMAVDAGVPIETEMNLFLKLCPSEIVAVTGSNGKSTTTALMEQILRRGERDLFVGGNIGHSLLSELDEMTQESIVLLELSSFQLEHAEAIRFRPHVAVITNIQENHLDRHGTMDAYIRAKQVILQFQREDDYVVCHADDPRMDAFCQPAVSRMYHVSRTKPITQGFMIQGDELIPIGLQNTHSPCVRDRLLEGAFNVDHMAMAALASWLVYKKEWVDWPSVCTDVFSTFQALEHRLECFARHGGMRFYNDSISTNPDSTIAALHALSGPIVLIAGGYDKGLPFTHLALTIAETVRVLLLYGQTAGRIRAAVEACSHQLALYEVPDLETAVQKALAYGQNGDAILLSPACASYDMFAHFAERGTCFKQYVKSQYQMTISQEDRM